jgi:ribose-phosphate pyrophosphokinase
MTSLAAFAEDADPARRLACALDLPFSLVALHRFPDGESLPTVPPGGPTVIVYRTLDRPDAKLMPLLLACDAWRRAGAERLVLVAPYLSYLRQDAVFAPGQPLSRDVFGQILGSRFDRVVTVEPHLHRTGDLTTVFQGASVTVLSSAGVLADALAGIERPLVVGPDAEAAAWAGALARRLDASHMTFRKTRYGDRHVELSLDDPGAVQGRNIVLVDDICSSGATLEQALVHLRAAGARRIDLAVVHALFDEATDARLRRAGADRIISTDSCSHPTNTISLAPLLAEALTREIAA